jgi:hypothetical protein
MQIKDMTTSMSYFVAAVRRAKIFSMIWGILGGIGYSIEIRPFKTSASSDRCTTGSPSSVASFRGWGRENMSQKKGENVTSADLWTLKLTRSEDWRMTSTLGISEYFGGDSGGKSNVKIGLAWWSELVSSAEGGKSSSACRIDQVC